MCYEMSRNSKLSIFFLLLSGLLAYFTKKGTWRYNHTLLIWNTFARNLNCCFSNTWRIYFRILIQSLFFLFFVLSFEINEWKEMVTFCQSVWYFVYFLPTQFSPVQVYLQCNKHLYLYICILIKTWNILSGAKPTCEWIRYFTDRFIISKYCQNYYYFFFRSFISSFWSFL